MTLTMGEGKEPLRCVGIKLERDELWVISGSDVPAGTTVTLSAGGKSLPLTVEQAYAPLGRPEVFQVQLKCKEQDCDLVKMLVGNDAVDFDALRSDMARMHMPDQSLFRVLGLTKISTSHRAYPIRYKLHSLCILIPKDLAPSAASRLDMAQAAAQVVVLKLENNAQGRHSVRALWPFKLSA